MASYGNIKKTKLEVMWAFLQVTAPYTENFDATPQHHHLYSDKPGKKGVEKHVAIDMLGFPRLD